MADFQYNKLSLVMQNMDSENGDYFNSLNRDDRLFLQQRIEYFPTAIQRILVSRYKSQQDRVKANIELRQTSDKLNQLLPQVLRNHFNASEDELRNLAQEFADLCRNKVKPYIPAMLKLQPEFNPENSGFQNTNPESASAISESGSLVFAGHGQKFSELGSDALNGVKQRERSIPEKFPEISEKHSETKTSASQHQIKAGLEFQNQTTVNATVRNKANRGETAQSENSVNAQRRLEAQLLAYEKCANFVNGLGLTAPTPDKCKTLSGCS